VSLDILAVNQATGFAIALPPTNGDQDAFCTGDSTPGFDGANMNTVTAVALNIPAANVSHRGESQRPGREWPWNGLAGRQLVDHLVLDTPLT
jgi:hypothetical protein